MDELDTLRRRRVAAEAGEKALKGEIAALRESVKERDRVCEGLKDQIKYYLAFAENSLHGRASPEAREMDAEKERLATELEEAKEKIKRLNEQNGDLRGQFEVVSSGEQSNSSVAVAERISEGEAAPSPDTATSSSSSPIIKPAKVAAAAGDEQTQTETEEAGQNDDAASSTVPDVPILSREVAFVKLEQKFNQAMGKVASLSAEKEHLEHLNVQLQQETETVGKFIFSVSKASSSLCVRDQHGP